MREESDVKMLMLESGALSELPALSIESSSLEAGRVLRIR